MDICNDFYDLNDKELFIVFQSSMINYATTIKLIKVWRLFIKQLNIDSTYLLSMDAYDQSLHGQYEMKQTFALMQQILE